MKNWTQEQFKQIVSQWDNAIEAHYPEHLEAWRNPDVHFTHINEVWNYLEASKRMDWDRILVGRNLRVMDMGAGTGWLSAYLSLFDNIEKIYTLDSSRFFLSVMVPAIISKMKGKAEKIELIEGLFTPILMEDGAMDVIVASSSLHHAENLQDTLVEIHRVLKKDGILIILNETPETRMQYFMNTMRHFKNMCKKTFFMKYDARPTYISSSCILHDPHLGDKSYAIWYWKEALARAKFPDVTVQVTDLRTQRNAAEGEFLTHFICRKG